jgi:peptidoglycan/LPS O-acetylase OafA/YrhL
MSMKENASRGHASDASVNLDAVRGLAALVVFLGHGRGLFLKSGLRDALAGKTLATSAQVPAAAPAAAPLTQFTPHETLGHEAVIVFFVLSGYFVGGSVLRATRKGVFSWRTYLYQRLTRLWIVLIPALLLGWALDVGGMNLLHSPRNIYSGPAGQEEISPELASRVTPTVFAGNVFFLQGIVSPSFGTNTSLWSLSYEFWYYILFPFLVTLLFPAKRIQSRIIAAVCLLAIFIGLGPEISSYFLIWLFGAAVALLPLRLSAGNRRPVTAAAALLFLVTMFLMLKYHLDLYLADVILTLVFSFLLWTMLHAERSTVSAPYRMGAQTLSNMSYTLYLVHMPFFALVSALIVPVWQPWALSLRAVLMLLGVYGVVFAASALMYFCFERNTEEIRKRLSGRTWKKAWPWADRKAA